MVAIQSIGKASNEEKQEEKDYMDNFNRKGYKLFFQGVGGGMAWQ